MTLIKKSQNAELHEGNGFFTVYYTGLYTWGFDSAERNFFGDSAKEEAILFFNEFDNKKTMATPQVRQAEQHGAIL